MLKKQNGITLIALIITIIVMLILVGVTINVALNGGLFSKAEEATTKTKISQIQEALAIKEGEILADNDGVVEGYTLTLDNLDLPAELKNEFSGKLIIGTDGKLYYDASVVTDISELNTFESMGIQPYIEKPTSPFKMEPNTNYVFNNPGTIPFIMNLTTEGYLTIEAGDMTLLEENVDEKIDPETGKVKGIFSIPDGDSYEVLIYTNNEDDTDTNVYIGMGEQTFIFEKVLPREEINVYSLENQGAKMILIEISETEAIVKISDRKPEKYEIEECSDLRNLSGCESYNLENNGISYNKVAASKEDKKTGMVYYDILDGWYPYGLSNNTLQILEPIIKRDTTMSEDEIQAIINEANAETN